MRKMVNINFPRENKKDRNRHRDHFEVVVCGGAQQDSYHFFSPLTGALTVERMT